MAIEKVGVLGCGLMGSGIAQVSAAAGYSTVVKEVAEEFLKKGMASIEKSLGKFVEKGTITADTRNETLSRLKGTTKFEDLADCDIVIEAITENLEVKRETYATIDKIVKPSAMPTAPSDLDKDHGKGRDRDDSIHKHPGHGHAGGPNRLITGGS